MVNFRESLLKVSIGKSLTSDDNSITLVTLAQLDQKMISGLQLLSVQNFNS